MPPWTIVKRFLGLLLPVQQYFGSSNIPQFILDTQHPWIEENQLALSSIDARDALCNATSSLRADLPDIPPDLFHRLEIDNNRAEAGTRPGWHNADARVREILDCPMALESCEQLDLCIYVHSSQYDELSEPLQPPDTLPRLFKNMLEGMPRLETLEWRIPSIDWISFAKFNDTFSGQPPLRLSNVENLKVEAHMDALISAAPSLKSLEIAGQYDAWRYRTDSPDPWDGLVKAANTREHLKAFGMTAKWTPGLAETVLSAMPQLENLTMGGSMGPYWNDGETSIFKDVLSVVKSFKHLTHLDLPSVDALGLGFYGGPWCGNAYFGADGTKYGRQVSMESMEGTEKAAAIVVEALPQLASFSLDGRIVRPERTETGEVKLRWPWTGRVREALLQEWPRYDGRDGPEYGEMEDPDGPVLWTWEEDERMFAGDKDPGRVFVPDR